MPCQGLSFPLPRVLHLFFAAGNLGRLDAIMSRSKKLVTICQTLRRQSTHWLKGQPKCLSQTPHWDLIGRTLRLQLILEVLAKPAMHKWRWGDLIGRNHDKITENAVSMAILGSMAFIFGNTTSLKRFEEGLQCHIFRRLSTTAKWSAVLIMMVLDQSLWTVSLWQPILIGGTT